MQSGGVLPFLLPGEVQTPGALPLSGAPLGEASSLTTTSFCAPPHPPWRGASLLRSCPSKAGLGHWACGYSRCTATRERRCTDATSSKDTDTKRVEEHSHRGLGGLGLPRGRPRVTMQVSRWSQGVKRPGKTPDRLGPGSFHVCGDVDPAAPDSLHHERSHPYPASLGNRPDLAYLKLAPRPIPPRRGAFRVRPGSWSPPVFWQTKGARESQAPMRPTARIRS
jgi:hypothetical protein